MPTTYTNGLKLPDLGSIDWYNAYKNNIDILDPIVGTVNGVATTYAPISHNHDASEITSGTIDIARLPPAALERLTTVADQTARYALTTSTVQLGDTVKQLDTGIMYLVVDTTKLNSADGYVEYSAGTASKAIADEDGTSIKTGYVNVAGNQTVTGNKTWSGNNTWGTNLLTVKDSAFTKGTTVTNRKQNLWKFTDSNDSVFGIWEAIQYTNGKQGIRLNLTNKYKNGALDPTGNDVPVYFEFLQKESDGQTILKWANGLIDNGIYPLAPYGLGNAAFQWSAVYAQTYYYNGTEFLSKFVTMDSVQTINASKTINSATPFLYIQNPNKERGVTPSVRQWGRLNFADKNGSTMAGLEHSVYSNGVSQLAISINNLYSNGALNPSGTSESCAITLELSSSGGKSIVSGTNASTDLGTSSRKWKTLNGINPGALSLPDYDETKALAVDTTGWTYDGSTANQLKINNATQTINGWLFIRIENVASTDRVIIRFNGNLASDPAMGFSPAGTGINLIMPIPANKLTNIYLTKSPLHIKFYPCLGNV